MSTSEIILLEPDLDNASVRKCEQMQKTNTYNIAILGAGILGLTNAYTLHKAGHSITLHDPAGFPAYNASYKAGGMLAPYSEIEHMPHNFIEAGLESIKLWRDIINTLPTSQDFHQNGSLFIAHNEDLHMLSRFAKHLPKDAPVDFLEKETIQNIEPALPDKFTSGFWIKDEAHLHPAEIIEALTQHLQNKITLKTEAANPEGLKSYDHIIDCRGYAARDKEPTLRGVKGELAIVENTDFKLSRPVRLMHPRYPLYIVPRPDNIFMIGATIIESAEDERPSVRSSLELLSALYSLHPSFSDAKLLNIEAGIRPSYPDNLPRIFKNGKVISCNGSYRHGYLMAPIMAQTIAKIVTGQETDTIFSTNQKDKAA